MHTNPAFRATPEARSLDFARTRGFGILSVNGPNGPLLSHVPFLLSGDATFIDLHLTRSNPILAALKAGAVPAVIAVNGPDGYISPDWYGLEDQVPTWNYVAVHLRGLLERRPDDELHDLVDRQSAAFEDRLPKAPWTSDKMTEGVMARMMRMIVPVRMRLDDVQSTWKLNQNKPDAARLAAAEGLSASAIGSETRALAALMRAYSGTPE